MNHKPTLKVRLADPGEALLVTTLVNKAYEVEFALFGDGHLRTDFDEIVASFAEPGTFFLLAEEDDQVIASVRVQPQPDGLYFSMLAVHPARQGRGIGRHLIAQIEAESAARGLTHVRLNCIKERNLPAYYEQLGYIATHEEPENFDGVDFHFVYMEKRLVGHQ